MRKAEYKLLFTRSVYYQDHQERARLLQRALLRPHWCSQLLSGIMGGFCPCLQRGIEAQSNGDLE